ncbi:hypothetical protein [Polyangium jinanense]|uniref:Copper type II ascorbate-dependent monooxygenase C-terminal domain-containing protein n=1 Tax=Polyangium jinanense TaxID=2829994 RepID=A0A9X4ASL4_9BACT|nr:hypothetical protein [Polyangium jinanense]MDC3954923.1 hypothetical protein [Polyangium jinanense]MDC3981307.1 hypothetical protein [Polyangium jinanense]
MNRCIGLLLVAAPLVLAACGDAENGAVSDPDVFRLDLGTFTAPAGESFLCSYTDTITTREISVISAEGIQGPGGHHLTMYYVDNKRPVGSVPCSGTTEMLDWHFVVGAGGEGMGEGGLVDLAEGLAIKIPAGKQLMVQAHYINASGADQEVHDWMDIRTTDPSRVKAYAGDFVVLDDTFEIPAHASKESTSICEITEDTQLSMLLGHMHETGTHYKLETLDENGSPLKTLIDNAWQPSYASHPPVSTFTMEEPLVIPAGTRLRQTCSWDNTSSTPMLFPTEMCIAFGYYFPGESRRMCERVDEAAP